MEITQHNKYNLTIDDITHALIDFIDKKTRGVHVLDKASLVVNWQMVDESIFKSENASAITGVVLLVGDDLPAE